MRRLILASVLSLAVPASALADSLAYDVTPQNISSQHLKFEVVAQESSDKSFSVTIVVASGTGAVSPEGYWRLILWEHRSPSMATYASTPLDERQRMLFTAVVRERLVEGKLYYNFHVARDLLDRLTFMFVNVSPGMPSADEYGFAIGEFIGGRK